MCISWIAVRALLILSFVFNYSVFLSTDGAHIVPLDIALTEMNGVPLPLMLLSAPKSVAVDHKGFIAGGFGVCKYNQRDASAINHFTNNTAA